MKIKHLLSYFSILFLGALAVTNDSLKRSLNEVNSGFLFIFELFTLLAVIYLIRIIDIHFKDKGLSKKESTVYALFILAVGGIAIYFKH
jgi:hypothetical protein